MNKKAAMIAMINHLLGMSGGLPAQKTAFPNVSFTPIDGVEYQRLSFLYAKPSDIVLGNNRYIEKGIFQVDLCYPKGNGFNQSEEMADKIRSSFRRGTNVDGVLITNTPTISGAIDDVNRYIVPVSINFQYEVQLS